MGANGSQHAAAAPLPSGRRYPCPHGTLPDRPQVGFYPYLRGDSVRYHKVMVESAGGRRTLEKEVTCMQQICLPHVLDGCADETNLVVANIRFGQLGSA